MTASRWLESKKAFDNAISGYIISTQVVGNGRTIQTQLGCHFMEREAL